MLDAALPTVTLPATRLRLVTSWLGSSDGTDLGDRLASHTAVASVRVVEPELVAAHLQVMHADVVVVHTGTAAPVTAAVARLLGPGPTPMAVIGRVGDASTLLAALRAGVAGYFRDDLDLDELVFGLRRVALGHPAVDPALAGHIICDLARRTSHHATQLGPGWGLRPREGEVLSLLAEGMSNRQIADRLVLSQETVKTHLRTAYRRMGVASRTEAIALYHRTGERPWPVVAGGDGVRGG